MTTKSSATCTKHDSWKNSNWWGHVKLIGIFYGGMTIIAVVMFLFFSALESLDTERTSSVATSIGNKYGYAVVDLSQLPGYGRTGRVDLVPTSGGPKVTCTVHTSDSRASTSDVQVTDCGSFNPPVLK